MASAERFRLSRRFDRTGRLLGDAAMEKLATSRVTVFGLGGVGSYAAEGLVRSGVGHLTLVDFDDVCVTNINRQLHATARTVGKCKAELMAARCREINPEATVVAVKEFYREELAETLLTKETDFVVDAVDNVKAKLHLLQRCVQLGVPVVSCMGAAGRLDPTAVRVADLSETVMDQFAKDVRKHLRRKYGIGADGEPTGIAAVFSVEPCAEPRALSYDQQSCGFLCVCPHKANDFHTCDHRTQINGSAAFVTSVFGMNAAAVVVRALARQASAMAEPPGAEIPARPLARG